MFNLIYFIFNFSYITAQSFRVQLQGPNPLFMNCQNIQESNNGFYGPQYFYDSISKSGAYTNLDKITFYLWFNIHQKMILNGKQILFSFVDGYGPDSTLNLMVYYQKDKQNQYYLAVSNDKITPEKKRMSISQTNDLYMGSWNFLLFSLDQTNPDIFINIKFFSTQDQQMQQTRDILPQQKFKYSFGRHSRITNEQLYEQTSDYKACVNIANFYYINGWSTIDSEIHADYALDLKFLLRPYNKSLNYDTAQLVKSTNNIEFSGSVGIKIYKNTQIIYNLEQFTSFTIGFWMKIANISSNFLIVSFTDDLIEKTSIGFGVDKNKNFLLYQLFSNKIIGKVYDQQWQHITAALLEISLDQNFVQTNKKKFIRIFVDNQEIYSDFIYNFLIYKRLVIGPVKLDTKRKEVIDIQDIKIFNGFGIVTSNTDCLLFVGEYCLFCKAGTHYCKEQDPLDDIFFYNCPAGYKNTTLGCQPITQLNCFRVLNNSCVNCKDGYFLNSGICSPISNYIYQPYSCKDQNALYCEQQIVKSIYTNTFTNVTNIIGNQISLSKLCQALKNQYDPDSFTCTKNNVPNCLQAQFSQSCYKCQPGFYVASSKKCAIACASNGVLKFRDSDTSNNQCIQYCPNRYLFSYTCTNDKGIADYYCDSRKNCSIGELDLQYICLNNEFKQVGKSKGCKISLWGLSYSDITCKSSCKYCYGTQDNHCLGCYDGIYFSPYITSCLKNCSDQQNRFIYHNQYKMMCEYQCPSNLLQQKDFCVKSCSVGYSQYQNLCLPINKVEFYLDTIKNQMTLCPVLCLTCTSSNTCGKCINDYPFYNNQCLFSCFPLVIVYKIDRYICKLDCDPDELRYENSDFQGYSIKQCFQNSCGTIQAGGIYQTYRHQTDNLMCALPCDDGYFGDVNSLSCKKCSDTCFKCQNYAHFCTECYPSTFLLNNACFENCGDKFSNYLTFECEGSCSSGTTLNDISEGLKACVPSCGEIFTDYKYKLNGNCIKAPPKESVYCVGFECNYCSSLCQNCNGQLDTNCTACFENYFFYNNTCVTDCGTLKYDKVNWQCVNTCPTNLFESSGYELLNQVNKYITSCFITCLYNKYQFLDKCYNSQPNNCYCEARDNYIYCGKCSKLCLTCTTAYSNSCSQCNTQAFLYNTTCVYDCPSDAPLQDLTLSKCVNKCSSFSYDGYCVFVCDSHAYIDLVKKACYSSGCPLGTYNQANTKYCYACYPGCSSCLDGTNTKCQSCFDGYFLNQGTSCTLKCQTDPDLVQDWINGLCVQSCPSGSYLQSLSDGSLACKEQCPKYYYSNICVTQCPNQTYLEGLKCLNCAGPCSVCFGTQIDQCTQCDQGYYRDGTTCYQSCPLSKPYINISDQTCISNCLDYLYLSQMICFDQCPSFLYKYELNGKKECVEQCYLKSYLSNGSCYECDPICKKCFGPNNGNCVECELPYYLADQSCQLTCPLFYDTIEYKCKEACPVSLVAQNQLCQLQCNPGFLVYNQNCLNVCPTFAYLQEKQCFDCNLVCQTCFGGSENQCTSCIDNYFLSGSTCQLHCNKFYDFDIKQCRDDCDGKLELPQLYQCVLTCPIDYIICDRKCVHTPPDGYYSDGTQCQKCNAKCQKCVSSTSCTECAKNYYFDNFGCENQCSNRYLFMDPLSKTCVTKCPPQLYHLESFNKRFCVADCQYKFNGWCLDKCPIGMYLDGDCIKCQHGCLECESFMDCNKCQDGYFNENGNCLTSCLQSKSDRVHIKCVSECDQSLYQYQLDCLGKCPSNPLTYQYKTTCYNICPQGTYLDNQTCYECDEGCLSCIGPTNNDCYECAVGYYLENQICTKACPNLYDQVNYKCVIICPINMYQELNNCVSKCKDFQYKDQCIDSCPLNTYTSTFQCIECPTDCVECNSAGCLKCQIPTYLLNGLCDLFCPILYDYTKNECVDQCPTQTLKFLDNCFSQCPENTYELNSECQLSCPKYMIPKKNKCVNCPERCSECLDDAICVICFNTYYLYESQCYVTCPLVMPYAHTSKGVCLTQCTPDTFIKGFECVVQCDLITFQNQCLEQCPSGYYGQDICKPCRLECKECINYDICTQCNDNYYLEYNQCDTQCTKIKDLEKQQCVETCDKLLYKNFCYQQCPLNTYEFGNICVLNCNDGYYGSDEWKCVQCPTQCKLCQSEIQCSKCSTGFYLYQTDCLEECPQKLFSDPILNLCANYCPKRTFIFQNQCLFECPDGYLKDDENFICLESCSSQQYLQQKTCYQCSIECDGCYGQGNNRCIKCQKDYKLDDNGYCVGTSCKAGYYLQNQSCQKCQHKCLACQDYLQCSKCRGKNRAPSDCFCAKGYYDDVLYDDCQKCPCNECTSQTNCLTCKNNLQLPLCQCDRVLNEDWCITCEIAKVNIYFSDDLNQIIVYFGYLVTANLLNPFQPSSCQQWFDNSDDFGTNATCFLSWDRYSIVIQLKPYSKIKVGDSLNFKQNFYRDIDQGLCDNYFIKTFIENKINGPSILLKPYVLFSVPTFVSSCKIVEIKQILLEGTGQRIQKVINWQLWELNNEDAYLQLESFLVQQNNEMKIPIGILSPNTTYKITAKYINIFERVNYTVFQFTTLPIQAPYVFLSFNPLKANVYVFDCHISFQDMKNSFTIEINVVEPNNDSQIYISQQEQINPKYEIYLNESLLPKQQPLLFVAITAFSIIKEHFILESKNIEVSFLQTDRFIGLDNKINARGYDRNIVDEIQSTKNLNYQWLCINLFNLQPCKTDENQIIQFPSKRVVDIFADSQNTTLGFYVKASKDNRWTVKEQLIVITNFNIEEELIFNSNQPSNYINPNDEITIIIKNNQKYAFIMQQFKILSSQKIYGQTIKFRLADLSVDTKSPVYIYLLPGNQSLSFQLNNPPKSVQFNVTPLKGMSLDYFNYTLQNLGVGSKFNIYYYFLNSTLTSDVLLQETINGIPLIVDSQQIEGSFQLPNGISDDQISILCMIETDYGAKSFYSQQVFVARQNYELANLVETYQQKTNFSDLKSLHTMIIHMQLEQQQVCLKQCSGVGTCLNNKCQCPPEYYFDDCSGNEKQYQNYLDVISKSITNLVKINISNNENFKQFSQTLLHFSQFNQLLQNLSSVECQFILEQYVNNTNSRLVQINQYSINLQYHNNQDYNYSEIDIRPLTNRIDFQIAFNSTVFMWNKTLFSQDASIYLLQNCMKQFISNIIDLSLITLAFEEEMKYELDTAKINIIKSSQYEKHINFTNKSSTRLLNENKNIMYDIILSVYLRNFYAYDGYFPYPDQIYPLYDYSIRHSSRQENIRLQNSIYYKFKVLNITTNLVCLIRNQSTYYWTDEYCVLDNIDEVYFCNCSILAPVTIVNDLKYIYQGQPPTLIILPNILLIIYGIQVILVIGVALKGNQSYFQQENQIGPIENFKYGKVIGLIKRRGFLTFGSSVAQAQYENLKGTIRDQNDDEQKFGSFNNFWKTHFLINLVLKQLTYLNLFFRSILIITRFNVVLIIAEILDLYWNQNSIFINICILNGSIVFIRVSQKFLQRRIKESSVLQEYILQFLQKLFVLMLFIFTLLAFMYLFFELKNQTNIIISDSITFLFDLLLIDLIEFGLNKFLGQGTKKMIKDKLKLFTKMKGVQQTE